MAVRRKVLFWAGVPLVLLMLAGAFVGLVVLSFREAPRRTVTFPDGSRLTVLGASLYGQPFTTDKPWQATLRRWLPAQLQGWLPVAVTAPATLAPNAGSPTSFQTVSALISTAGSPTSVSNGLWPPAPLVLTASSPTNVSNSLWAWFTFTNTAASVANRYPWAWSCVVTENGSHLGALPSDVESLMAGSTRVYRLLLYSFPRRQREFDLQFYDLHMNLIGSVNVPNPVR